MKKYNKEWLIAAGIRAVKTFCQTLLGMVTVGAAFTEVDWINAVSVSGVAALLSIVTSLSGLPESTYDGYVSSTEVDNMRMEPNKKSVRFKVVK